MNKVLTYTYYVHNVVIEVGLKYEAAIFCNLILFVTVACSLPLHITLKCMCVRGLDFLPVQ